MSKFVNPKQGEPKLTDAEFAEEMWHHEGIINMIASGAVRALGEHIYTMFADAPDNWDLAKFMVVLRVYEEKFYELAVTD